MVARFFMVHGVSAIWQVHWSGPRIHCARSDGWGSLAPQRKGKFGGETAQPKQATANCCCHQTSRKEVIPPITKSLWSLL